MKLFLHVHCPVDEQDFLSDPFPSQLQAGNLDRKDFVYYNDSTSLRN